LRTAEEADIGISKLRIREPFFAVAVLILLAAAGYAQSSPAQTLTFLLARTTIAFTLGDTVHTVHGSFALQRGQVTYNPATGEISGEIVVAAATGHSGNSMRDRKMHKEILESAKYPEITFRPDRVDGRVGMHGTSNVQVHGVFAVHGTEHEISVPIQVEMATDHWAATGHFVVPYAKWGMKNPSSFLLRVSESVEIDIRASGENPKLPATE
jgi:polyisoprenoid-binding protein YceI